MSWAFAGAGLDGLPSSHGWNVVAEREVNSGSRAGEGLRRCQWPLPFHVPGLGFPHAVYLRYGCPLAAPRSSHG